MPRAPLALSPVLFVSVVASCLGACEPPSAIAPPPSPARPRPPSATKSVDTKAPPGIFLPRAIWPKKNLATLTVDPARDTFDGEMTIELDVREPTNVVWLNREDLTIARAELTISGASSTGTSLAIVDGGPGRVGLVSQEPIPVGAATLRVLYKGILSETEVDGASRQVESGAPYVFTHFEPLAARRVFPCFDEPAFKSPWQLTLRVKKGDKAVSNTPILSETEEKDGFFAVRFAETKPLPSYLVAFAVGPFGFVDVGPVGKKKTPTRIVVPRGKEAWATFAKESTGPVLSLLEDYFGEGYPYEKLDLIAVPLFGGAMENPGLVTYRQSLILAKPGQESTGFRRAFASVNAHELSHQWFGDLVTTETWDDLWLNEAFATWMTPKIIEKFRPEWDIPTQRAASANGAMRADSLVTARAIRQPITSNDDIKNAFDGITYQKGAATIAMFERWVGPDVFQKGVRRYMREHAHRTAKAADFLGAVSAEAGRDVATPFQTFLTRPGVPVLATEVHCDGKGPRLSLRQSRYVPLGADAPKTATDPWQIPVCARASDGKKESASCTLLAGAEGEVALPTCPRWVLPNDGGSGYFRTAPAAKDLKALLGGFSKLTPAEKIVTTNDVSAAVRAGSLEMGAVLELVPTLARDENVHVRDLAVQIAGGLRDGGLVARAELPAYTAWVRKLFGELAKKNGAKALAGEGEEAKWARASVLELVADQGGDTALRAECTNLAKAWLADRGAVEPEVLGVVLGVAAAYGDAALFDAYLAEAKRASDRVDRERLVWALGSFREPTLHARALGLVLSKDLDARESVRILFASLRLPETTARAYTFLTEQLDAIVARLPRDYGAGFPQVGAALCDTEKANLIEGFFAERSKRFVGGPRQLAQSLEGMRQCGTTKARALPHVATFFRAMR